MVWRRTINRTIKRVSAWEEKALLALLSEDSSITQTKMTELRGPSRSTLGSFDASSPLPHLLGEVLNRYVALAHLKVLPAEVPRHPVHSDDPSR